MSRARRERHRVAAHAHLGRDDGHGLAHVDHLDRDPPPASHRARRGAGRRSVARRHRGARRGPVVGGAHGPPRGRGRRGRGDRGPRLRRRLRLGRVDGGGVGGPAAAAHERPVPLRRARLRGRPGPSARARHPGNGVTGEIVVRNDSTRPTLPGRLDIPVGRGLVEFGVPFLRPGTAAPSLSRSRRCRAVWCASAPSPRSAATRWVCCGASTRSTTCTTCSSTRAPSVCPPPAPVSSATSRATRRGVSSTPTCRSTPSASTLPATPSGRCTGSPRPRPGA